MKSALGRVARAVWAYLKDWKNLLTHGLIGVAIILIALFLPVRPIYRVLILVLAVTVNVLRMRLEKRSATKKAEQA